MTAQDEAIQIFSEVLAELGQGNHDLKSIRQRCYHACHLLGWTDARDWFYRELNGYPDPESGPEHRRIQGVLTRQPSAGFHVALEKAVEDQFSTKPEHPGEPTTLIVYDGIDWLIETAAHGYRETTGETREEYLSYRRTNITMEKVKIFDAAVFARALRRIESHVYTFSSQQYALLKYGNALSDVWQDYRRSVDAVLERPNLTKHWQAIEGGLRTGNPESWRNAVFGCRNLLTDVAAFLWQDPRPTYTHLKNPKGNELDVQSRQIFEPTSRVRTSEGSYRDIWAIHAR